MKSGKIESQERYDSIADGLRTPLGTLTFPIVHQLVDGILLASESAIESATRTLILRGKLVVEPSGAVPLAAILQNRNLFSGTRVGVIISGGNIDPTELARLAGPAISV